MIRSIGYLALLGLLTLGLVTGCQSDDDGNGTVSDTEEIQDLSVPYSRGPTSPPSVKGPTSPPPSFSEGEAPQAVTEFEDIKITLPTGTEAE